MLATPPGDGARVTGRWQCRKDRDRWAMAMSRARLGRLAMNVGQPAEARRLLRQAVALSGDLNDLYSASSRLGLLAQLEIDATQFAEALALHEQRAANYRLLGNRRLLAEALHDLGISARLAKDADRALPAFEESLTQFQALGRRREVAAVTASLGHLHMQRGALAQAAVKFADSLRVFSGQDTSRPGGPSGTNRTNVNRIGSGWPAGECIWTRLARRSVRPRRPT